MEAKNIEITVDASGLVDSLLEQIGELFPDVADDLILGLLHDLIVPADFIPALGANNQLTFTVDVVGVVGKLRTALATGN